VTKFPFNVVCVDDHAVILPPLLDENGVVIGVDWSHDRCFSLTIGKVYEVIGEDMELWRLVDDSGDDYLHLKDNFRVLPS
jgi:hypothetical protein